MSYLTQALSVSDIKLLKIMPNIHILLRADTKNLNSSGNSGNVAIEFIKLKTIDAAK